MLENLKHIKNPLTLISIFAGAAELGGAAVLPFISDTNQALYINFLIFFPIYTVTLFFATLNFNHRTLYAPSDYKDEKNFVSQFSKATPEELARKLSEETTEVQEDTHNDLDRSNESAKDESNSIPVNEAVNADQQPSVGPDAPAANAHSKNDSASNNAASSPESVSNLDIPDNDPKNIKKTQTESLDANHHYPRSLNPSKYDPKTIDSSELYEVEHRRLMASVALTEKLAVSKLSKALNLSFKEDVSFRPSNSSVNYVFDAADYSSRDGIQLVEVKLFRNRFDPKRFLKALDNAHNLNRTFHSNNSITLHLVVVFDKLDIAPWEIRDLMKRITSEYSFDIVVHITTSSDLQSDTGKFY